MGGLDPKKMQELMANPEVMKQVQEMQQMMSNPEVQKEMQQAQAFMQSDKMQEKMKELQNDPELQPMYDDIKQNGMGAMMKYMNDPKMLAKFQKAVSDAGAPVPPRGPPPPPQALAEDVESGPEIETLIDAAKYGDLEAVEDFIDVGRGLDEADVEQRTALHFAAGAGHGAVVQALVAAGADQAARDSKGNTALHYATGYGRVEATRALLDGGSNTGAMNDTGKRSIDLAKMNDQNPILQDADLVARLEAQQFVDQ